MLDLALLCRRRPCARLSDDLLLTRSSFDGRPHSSWGAVGEFIDCRRHSDSYIGGRHDAANAHSRALKRQGSLCARRDDLLDASPSDDGTWMHHPERRLVGRHRAAFLEQCQNQIVHVCRTSATAIDPPICSSARCISGCISIRHDQQ